jgi:hypothetical protein
MAADIAALLDNKIFTIRILQKLKQGQRHRFYSRRALRNSKPRHGACTRCSADDVPQRRDCPRRPKRPHHVALSPDKVRGVRNSQIVWSFAQTFSAPPLPYSIPRDDGDFAVFCFAKREDAETFRGRFGGECLPAGNLTAGSRAFRYLSSR